MSGTIPLLPLYAFIAWLWKTDFTIKGKRRKLETFENWCQLSNKSNYRN